jgi:hypothetical protein
MFCAGACVAVLPRAGAERGRGRDSRVVQRRALGAGGRARWPRRRRSRTPSARSSLAAAAAHAADQGAASHCAAATRYTWLIIIILLYCT